MPVKLIALFCILALTLFAACDDNKPTPDTFEASDQSDGSDPAENDLSDTTGPACSRSYECVSEHHMESGMCVAGACVDQTTFVCSADVDCGDHYRFCVDSRCVSCRTDYDCNAPYVQTCVNGSCEGEPWEPDVYFD